MRTTGDGVMRHARRGGLVVFMSAAILVTAASWAAGSTTERCGTATGGDLGLYGVTAVNVSCGRAKAVALSWLHRVEASACSRFHCSSRGFGCVAKPPAMLDPGYRVHCTLGDRRVAFSLSE